MKASVAIQYLVIVILLIVTVSLWQKTETLEKELIDARKPDLYTLMGQMQNQVHKLTYSLDEENFELADFYLHELEEAAVELVDANIVYNGEPVGELTNTMLWPVLEHLEDAVEEMNIELARQRVSLLVQACNNCHVSTGFGKILITERAVVNPFNQNFKKAEQPN